MQIVAALIALYAGRNAHRMVVTAHTHTSKPTDYVRKDFVEAKDARIAELEAQLATVKPVSEGWCNLLAAAQELVARVEAGEVRSRHTYTQMKRAIELITSVDTPATTDTGDEVQGG